MSSLLHAQKAPSSAATNLSIAVSPIVRQAVWESPRLLLGGEAATQGKTIAFEGARALYGGSV